MKSDNLKISARYSDGEYLSQNPDWHAADAPWKAENIHKIMHGNSLNPKTICEVGCGTGEILRRLSLKSQYAKTVFTGYEISDDAFELCRLRTAERLNFVKMDLFEDEKNYDVVFCIDVFEHVDDYMGFLRNLKNKGEIKVFHIPLDLSVSSLLRGRLIHARSSVGHLHYFTPETAIATLVDCGYQIIDTFYTPSFSIRREKGYIARLKSLPRWILFKISPGFASKLVGGVSLMVLAR